MEIKEFKDRKLKMEQEILYSVTKIANDFKADTGYCPESIAVHIIDASCMADVNSDFIIIDVTSDVEI